jgi:integrase/recombinase XerD
MRDLRKDLRRYIDLRRALGYKLRKHEPRLNEFIAYLKAKGADRITTKLAVTWAMVSSKGHKHSCFERLSFIRSFARHMSSMDARTEIPPTGTLRRPEIGLRPYIYTQAEIDRLTVAARNLYSPRKLRCHTYYCLVGLLATTGMRSGEVIRLAWGMRLFLTTGNSRWNDVPRLRCFLRALEKVTICIGGLHSHEIVHASLGVPP